MEAIDIGPNYANTWANLGIAYEDLGDKKKAKKAFKKAYEIDPENNDIKEYYNS